MGDRMKKAFVSLVAVAALAASAGGASVAAAQSDPDANGDVHSNCHTGSKFLGAGGNDKGEPNECTPVTPPGPAAPTAAPTAAARAPSAAPAAVTAGAAAPVVAAPRVTG